MISGFHYSGKSIPLGAQLTSSQDSAARWKFVLPVYQEVAASRGLLIPNQFAYCYPDLQDMTFAFCCRAEAKSAVRGNCQFSPLMALSARLKAERDIRDYADRYLDLDSGQRQELIGEWSVVEILVDSLTSSAKQDG